MAADWLDDKLGPPMVQQDGTDVAKRASVNFRNGPIVTDMGAGEPLDVDFSGMTVEASGLPATASSFWGVTCTDRRGALLAPVTAAAAIVAGYRIRVAGTGGGVYGGAGQTAYPAFFADIDTAPQGQQIGFFAGIRGLGRGNAMFGNAFVEHYGGGDVTAPTGTPEGSPLGEYELTTGFHIFRATVTGTPAANATTIQYTAPSDEDCLGCRLVLNTTKQYTTGTLSSIDGSSTVLTFGAGADFTALATASGVALNSGNWYLKLASTVEAYANPAVGDDVNPHDIMAGAWGETNLNVGHWYQVVDGTQHTLTLAVAFDVYGLTCTAGTIFMLCQGAVPTAVDPVANTITIPSNTMHWSNADALVSGPQHLVATIGCNLILHSLWKSGRNGANGIGRGLRIVNYGPQALAEAIRISGATVGGFYSGIVYDAMTMTGWLIDSSRVDAQGFIERSSTDGGRNVHYFGTAAQTGLYYNAIPADEAYGALTVLGKFALRTGLANSGGARHGRLTTGAVGASSTADVTITWMFGWGDTNYTLIPAVEDSTGYLTIVGIKSCAAGSAIVTVKNNDGANPHTGTLHYHAFHD